MKTLSRYLAIYAALFLSPLLILWGVVERLSRRKGVRSRTTP